VHVTARGVAAAGVASALGFTMSFAVSPDPTGLLPVLVGVGLAAVLTPAFYFGLQRLSSTERALRD
jgi:phosphotransferase system  glucose/maltose/N-acetylglucosamine-specific IIC component